ncbi:MAG: hypothetical protein HYX87_09270 [Chloroflexi bacterium]|nr:hypothetical protein [Chloroflexota bacterium]
MNDAATLIKQAESLGATLQAEERLKWKAPLPLPADLLEAMRQRKAEIIALLRGGTTGDIGQLRAEALAAVNKLRPYLSSTLRELPDDTLLKLVHWHLVVATEQASQRNRRALS